MLNVRASIQDEVIAMVSTLTNVKRVFRVSYLVTDDAHGAAVGAAVELALAYVSSSINALNF